MTALTVITSMSVGTDLYPHMPILRPQAVQYSTNGASLARHLRRRISVNVYVRVVVARRSPICPILGFWGRARFSKIGDSLPL